MKLKASLWLICKTYVSLKFGSSCIITAHFSSCPFIPCQASQAEFPYAPVKTGNCFKRLNHLYFFFSQTVWGCLCLKKKTSRSQPSSKAGSVKASLHLSIRSSPCLCASLIFWPLEIPSVPSLSLVHPCTRYRWIWTDRDWGRTNMFSALFNQSLSLHLALSTPWLDKML